MTRIPHTSYDVESFTLGNLKGQYLTCYRSETQLRDFLENPSQDLKGRNNYGQQLKDDRATTVVVRNLVDKCPIVIKRYNTKNTWHALRRTVRRSRAENCWIYADKLQKLGVAIAPPVAFVQEYLGPGLKGCSWYLSKFVDGPSCLDHLQAIDDEAEHGRVIEQIVGLMTILRDHHITHGDMKATNLLLAGDRVVLLDLDAMNKHSTADRACTGINKDVSRFLQNWRDQPALLKLAREKLKRADFTLPN